jgi:hypothetical protein
MTREEAEARIKRLDSVSDICATDPERIVALQEAIVRLGARRRGLMDLFRQP